MAEMGRMTAAQAVDKVMASEHADVIRESVRFMIDALMEVEATELAGAEFGERAPERRVTQRNGYRDRLWGTRAGAIGLAIPKLRSGPGDFPSVLEPRRRAEQGAGRRRAGGLRQRRLDPQGRPRRRAARRQDEQRPGLGSVPPPGRAGAGVSRAAAGG